VDLIARGRDADVYAVDEDRVLRRYRDANSSCEHEARVMEWVRGQGYPVPRVFSSDGPDMVLERLAGPTMLASVMAGTTTIEAAGRTMAELLQRLHSLVRPPGSRAGHAVRHLDFHPFNIIESPTGPVVIDWRNSDVRPPAVDVALTAVILAQVALSPRPDAPAARGILSSYLAAVGPLSTSGLDQAMGYRSADCNATSAELDLLRQVPETLLTEAT
jgi:aminoglycoside phosphotransferase (APT) family kinase protein